MPILRLELRELVFQPNWRLVLVTDDHAEQVVELQAESEWGAVMEVAERLRAALQPVEGD